MISFRKALFTLLAPLGAATIIGTGFATWVFGIQGVQVEGGPVNNNVAVTTEVTNGSLKLLTVPNLLVFSEGTQGKNDLFDGISFYTNKKVEQGAELKVTMRSETTHLLSLVYDDNDGLEKPLLYFSWASDNKETNTIIGGELKKSDNNNSLYGNWSGSVSVNNITYGVNIGLNGSESETNSGYISIVEETNQGEIAKDDFTFTINSQTTNKDITITDSTFAFRYCYDNPKLINEDETGYRLNVKFGMSLNSREPFEFEFEKKDNSLTFDSENDFTLSYNSGVYSLDANIANQTISYTNLEFERAAEVGTDPIFKYGTYRGTSTSGITCELTLSESTTNQTNFNAVLKIGAMDSYLSLIDDFTSKLEGDYFNITSEDNIDYAQTVLHIDIDRTHATTAERQPYIEFTCQLANYLRYASSDVKPTSEDKYYGLRVASLLGEREFKINVSADYSLVRG